MSIGEWIEDRYFDGLLREADACALRDIFRVNASVETQRRADQSMHNGWLISDIYSFCKLSRKIVEKQLGEEELLSSLEDWAQLLVSIGTFIDGGEHTLQPGVLHRFYQAPLSVRSRCQSLGAKDLGLLFLIEGRLNVCFKPAETWKELAKQVDDVNSRNFAARGRP